jgi:hypothetical protein
MPRPVKGYERPTSVPCIVCGGEVEVAERGRLPEGHPACVALSQDVTRVMTALETALEGRSLDEIRKLRRSLWQTRILGDGNSIWNRVDNPAKRKARG